MRYIFISPHLDDISLSCGGIVNYLHKNEINVEIWSIFAGSPVSNNLTPFAESLHNRWKLPLDAPKTRRAEDIIACEILGALHKHFDFLDCIYRFDSQDHPLINHEEDLYQNLPDSQNYLVDEISTLIGSLISQQDIIISPLAIGNHVDHQIIFRAIQKLSFKNLFFYEDYPYVIKTNEEKNSYHDLIANTYSLTKENMDKWHDSIAAYKSQISTFWISVERMKEEISIFFKNGGGQNLWQPVLK